MLETLSQEGYRIQFWELNETTKSLLMVVVCMHLWVIKLEADNIISLKYTNLLYPEIGKRFVQVNRNPFDSAAWSVVSMLKCIEQLRIKFLRPCVS